MPRPSSPTRRGVLRDAAILAAGLTVGRSLTRGAGAQTPVASQVPIGGPAALVDVDWLAAHAADEGTVLVALMPEKSFEAAHIPASFQTNTPDLEVVDTSDTGIAAWETTIRERIGDLHIVPESRVVAYDGGSLFAARLWWVLRYLGHADVRVVDGGLLAWQGAGQPTSTGPVVMTTEKRPPYPGAANPDVLAQRDEVLAAVGDPNVIFVDARAPDEYAKGHIPGAVNVNYPRNTAGDPPRYLAPEELAAMYRDAGVTPDRQVIPYCSSGVRSAVTAFALSLAGYPRVALYTGSWNEWSTLAGAPITTGDAP